MRGTFGCAGSLALVAFILGLPFSLFFEVDHWGQRLFIAAMPAAMAFLAGLVLLGRDMHLHSLEISSVQSTLRSRTDISDSSFVEHFPSTDPDLLLRTRETIAAYFDVPAFKIHPEDDLREDFRADRLDPSFQFFVVDSVIAQTTEVQRSFTFSLSELNSVGDLTNAIERVLDDLHSNRSDTES